MTKSFSVVLSALAAQLLLIGVTLAHPSRHCIDVFRSQGARKLYRVDANGHSVGVKRTEKLFGRAIEVVNITVPKSGRINLGDIFNGDVTFLRFGKTEVYLGTSVPSSGGMLETVEFAATSFKRGDSEIQSTGGNVEVGLLIVFKDLPPSAQERIFEAAKRHEGTRKWTCTNANCRVLASAGFSMSRSAELSDYYFTSSLLKAVLNKDLHYSGYRVKFDVVRLVPEPSN